MADAWSLHPQLDRDTATLGDLPLSRVLVINDANYPWLLLVPRRPDITEVIDLDEVEQAQLMTEVTRVARALRHVTACHKLNIAALGNAVPQLHVHVIARFRSDPMSARNCTTSCSRCGRKSGSHSACDCLEGRTLSCDVSEPCPVGVLPD